MVSKKIDYKSVGLGAGLVLVLCVVPFIGDFFSKGIASVRSMIGGKGGKK